MRTFRNAGREITGVLAVLIAIVCAAGIGWSEQASHKVSGAHIQMGEGHFNRDGKAFHYWDKEKEIPSSAPTGDDSIDNDVQLKRALDLLKSWDVFKQMVQKKAA